MLLKKAYGFNLHCDILTERKKRPRHEENVVEEENPDSENIEKQDHPELQQPRVPEYTPKQRSVVGSQQPTQSSTNFFCLSCS